MNLTEQHDVVQIPPVYYAFVEKVGSIPVNASAAWQTAHQFRAELSQHNRITGALSLYRMPQQIYRAGFALEAPPKELPSGLRYELFPGGKYARFTLIGPYSDLGPATTRVFQLIESRDIATRDAFYIENYVSDPASTPEADLITEILAPIH